MRTVTTEKELAKAVQDDLDTIVIEGDLASKTIKIKATGKAAWAIAFGAISLAAYSLIATLGTGGATAPATATSGLIAGGAAVTVLGSATTASAIAVAVAAGGVGVLSKLRSYKIVEKSQDRVVLARG
ncbi:MULTISPECIES: hypothetical protein [Enterobacter]|nr:MULTISPECIES: hypothetical protein [Enterobacter]HDT2076644.1 hypothetical protein [Enterobacter roggenkampii]HEG2003453.1 hypothetical protein [Enterobacter asburiae]MCD2457111.1 hypothetical protein [Enterobacter cloacae complex sp. 2021EL-01261]MCR1301884.1 hypothetical protein [Enterobacter sp. FL1277]MCR1306451.1 hypothetical protein [Enterobacter sp. BT1271]